MLLLTKKFSMERTEPTAEEILVLERNSGEIEDPKIEDPETGDLNKEKDAMPNTEVEEEKEVEAEVPVGKVISIEKIKIQRKINTEDQIEIMKMSTSVWRTILKRQMLFCSVFVKSLVKQHWTLEQQNLLPENIILTTQLSFFQKQIKRKS